MLPAEHYEQLAQSTPVLAGQVYASLTIAAAQSRANELQEEANALKRIEILALLTTTDSTILADCAYRALAELTPPQGDKGWQHHGLKASVAVTLGIDTQEHATDESKGKEA